MHITIVATIATMPARDSALRSVLQILSGVAMRRALAMTLAFPLLSASVLRAQVRPIEHPGILHKDDNCSACHNDKTRGYSVHSAMEIACTICHQAQTQGDMTLLQLALPKGDICFSCHEKTMLLKQHPDAVKQLCVDCHDAHSSSRRMLLLPPLNRDHSGGVMMPPATPGGSLKATSNP